MDERRAERVKLTTNLLLFQLLERYENVPVANLELIDDDEEEDEVDEEQGDEEIEENEDGETAIDAGKFNHAIRKRRRKGRVRSDKLWTCECGAVF